MCLIDAVVAADNMPVNRVDHVNHDDASVCSGVPCCLDHVEGDKDGGDVLSTARAGILVIHKVDLDCTLEAHRVVTASNTNEVCDCEVSETSGASFIEHC